MTAQTKTMTRFVTLMLFLLVSASGYSQAYKSLSRLDVDSSLAPFYHGVASGDPLADRVIIWTRVTTQQTGAVAVKWRVATDTTFTNVVKSDTTTTDASTDYCVKVDVTGLQPNTWYYYQFSALGRNSLTGRMKTVPDSTANVDHIRIATVSCSEYQNGYFNAYQSIANRNDIDAVVELGDYIYEYGTDSMHLNREVMPPNDIVSLQDYRTRFAYYHLDSQLRSMHQQYSFISIWDDHESANNSWTGGAQNHNDTTQGPWSVRLANAKKAYFEWIPIREHAAPDTFRIYRAKYYGNLAEFIYLDTRLEGRQEQTSDTAIINDTSRTIMGAVQRQWLFDRLHDQGSKWKIVAQQVMMAPLVLGTQVLNNDQWDGYPADRSKLLHTILQDSIKNVAILSGDIHSAWGNNLQLNGLTGDSVTVEFVTTSVTSQGFQNNPLVTPTTIYGALPYVKFVNLAYHGYSVLDITNAKTQNDYYYVDRIDTPIAVTTLGASWYENSGERFLRQGTASAPYATPLPPHAPAKVQTFTGVNTPVDPQSLVILGAYPNPSDGNMLVQYYQMNEGNAAAQMYDLSGKLVYEKPIAGHKGVNFVQISLDKIAVGNYVLVLTDGQNKYTKLISKAR